MTFRELQKHFIASVLDVYEQDEAEEVFFLLLEQNNALTKMNFTLRDEEQVNKLALWENQIERIKTGEPVQYVLQRADFWGMKFIVSPAVLIPRPETEELVQMVSKASSKSNESRILDIGTGSGCIALSLKKELPNAIVCGLDVSESAIAVAKQNAKNLNLNVEWVCAGIENFKTELLFDTIVSNPPYIPVSDKVEMAKNVLDYEPHLALFAPENDPLYFYKIIGDFAKKHLTKHNGKLYFEAHHLYAHEVYLYFAQQAQAELVNDMFGKARFIVIAFSND